MNRESEKNRKINKRPPPFVRHQRVDEPFLYFFLIQNLWCKLLFLLMKFCNSSAWGNFHLIQLSGSSYQKAVLSRSFGNLGIGISPSAAYASALQNIYFSLQKVLFLLSCGISTTLLQILVSLRFPIDPSKGVNRCSRKRPFELSKASIHWCFEKRTSPKISAYFPAQYPGWSPF